jgi:hypothetical protein
VSESEKNGRPGVGTVGVSVCGGIVGIVWGAGEVLWGNPYLGVFAIGGIFTVYWAVYYYFRVARHLRSGPHISGRSGETERTDRDG